MGIWGHRLFEDDSALDIRNEFRNHLGDGLSAPRAIARLVKDYGPQRDDPQDYASFWLAIAATAWDLGRLTTLAKRRALDVLDREIGLDEWKAAGSAKYQSRRKVYRAIRGKLLRPQPAPKPIRPSKKFVAPWKPGTLFSYRCLSGDDILCRVLAIHSDRGGELMAVDICRWRNKRPPTKQEAIAAPRRQPLVSTPLDTMPNAGAFYLYGHAPKSPPMNRVTVLATGLKFGGYVNHGGGATIFGGWPKLDQFLIEELGIR